LDGLGGIRRLGVKAEFRLRRISMRDVDQLFEQGRVLGDQPQACADQDAVERLLL
jgi:hypothetical protein